MENNTQDLKDADLGPMSKDLQLKAWWVFAICLAAIVLAVIWHHRDVL